MTRYLSCRRLDGHKIRPIRVRKTPPPPEFDPRTDQLVANRCTVYSTYPAPYGFGYTHNKALSFAKFVYRDIRVEIELCEYTNLKGDDCGLFQCTVAVHVFAWTEREIQHPPAGHETRLKIELLTATMLL